MRIGRKYSNYYIALLGIFLALGILLFPKSPVSAAVTNPTPEAKISFTFDDGLTSAYTDAAPTLAKYGLSGTNYIITGCVGMTTIPNTCHANTDTSYMTWAQIATLKNTYKWDIGSHTNSHPYLASKDATDGQPNLLTAAQVTLELYTSKSILATNGYTATDFASPYGDYSMTTLSMIAKYYASHRGFADQNNNVWPYNDYLLNVMQVQEGVTVAQVEAKIDLAIANKYWLILTMHNIMPTPSTDPTNYEYGTSELDQIASYVKSKQTAGLIRSVNVNEGLVTSDTNLFTNSTFNAGITGGWSTDSPTTIKVDTASNGSYPDAVNSVKLTATTKNVHLFSPTVAVDPNATYLFKSYLNVQKVTAGEVGFYVDEYDAAGGWISGQYKSAERSVYVESLNFAYKPSSGAVAKVRVQFIVTANSGITAYVDNVQFFPLTAVNVVTPTNLMPNGTFTSGLSGGWTTNDPTNITLNTAGNT
jgi:peptidoglycan/xylan/chitin deacetylase (PgdA/CDA1 family)